MLLGGLWHGANWTFVVWGAYHGLLLAFERWLGKQSLYHRLPRPVRSGITFVLVLFSWVLFRAATLERGGRLSRRHVRHCAAPAAGSLSAGRLIYTHGSADPHGACARSWSFWPRAGL